MCVISQLRSIDFKIKNNCSRWCNNANICQFIHNVSIIRMRSKQDEVEMCEREKIEVRWQWLQINVYAKPVFFDSLEKSLQFESQPRSCYKTEKNAIFWINESQQITLNVIWIFFILCEIVNGNKMSALPPV